MNMMNAYKTLNNKCNEIPRLWGRRFKGTDKLRAVTENEKTTDHLQSTGILMTQKTDEDKAFTIAKSHAWDHICIDSGASSHTFGNKKLLKNVRETKDSKNYCTSATGHRSDQTAVGFTDLTGWVKVYDDLRCNLISISTLAKQGYYALFTEKEAIIFCKKTKEIKAVGILAEDGLYYLDPDHAITGPGAVSQHRVVEAVYTIAESREEPSVQEPSEEQSAADHGKLVHYRAGHANCERLKRAIKKGKLKDLVNKGCTLHRIQAYLDSYGACRACMQGRMKQRKHFRVLRQHRRGEVVVSDVCGPLPRIMRGEVYFITFTDVATRYSWIYFLRRKSDSCDALRVFCDDIRSQTGQPKILEGLTLRSDNGGEYIGQEFKKLCAERGIRGRTGDADAPQTQGIAERLNDVILSDVRTFHLSSGRPGKLWGHAASQSVDIKNLLPTRLTGMSPQEAMFGTTPDIAYHHTAMPYCNCT